MLRDVTGPTWVLRQIGRSLTYVLLPVIAVLVFMPGPFFVRVGAAVGGVIMGLFYSLCYSIETTDRRLVKAGFAPGAAEKIRRERVFGPDAD